MKDLATQAWPLARIDKVATITSGNSISAKDRAEKYAASKVSGRPFISTKDVGFDGNVNMSPDVVIPPEAEAGFRLAPSQTTLVCSEGGSAGRKVGFIEQEAHFGNKLFAVSAGPRLDPKFLHYFHLTDIFSSQFRERLTGLIGGVSLKKFQSIEVPVPPLEQQKRIVAVLDQAFAALDRARAHAEANLAEADELFSSELSAAFARASFGVDQLPFDSLCQTITPKTKVPRKEYLAEGSYPIVSQESDLISGYYDDPEALMSVGEPVVVFGDHTRCLKYVDFDFVVGADGTKVLKPKRGIEAEYLYYGLRSRPIGETGYARHFKFLREISLPKLSLEHQQSLARHLSDMEDKCRVLREGYEAKLVSLAALRQSLLQKAFSGQLTA